MVEYSTDAIILSREETGEFDARYVLFTRDYGKCKAKARSVRKTTSRLAAHLEPGTCTRVRLVENRDMHIVDSLRKGNVSASLESLSWMDVLLPEWEPDENVWDELTQDVFSWQRMLSVLGWDATHASCAWCSGHSIAAFHVPSQDYVCPSCILSTHGTKNDMIYLL